MQQLLAVCEIPDTPILGGASHPVDLGGEDSRHFVADHKSTGLWIFAKEIDYADSFPIFHDKWLGGRETMLVHECYLCAQHTYMPPWCVSVHLRVFQSDSGYWICCSTQVGRQWWGIQYFLPVNGLFENT
jgi:hypothetical protein